MTYFSKNWDGSGYRFTVGGYEFETDKRDGKWEVFDVAEDRDALGSAAFNAYKDRLPTRNAAVAVAESWVDSRVDAIRVALDTIPAGTKIEALTTRLGWSATTLTGKLARTDDSWKVTIGEVGVHVTRIAEVHRA